LPATDKDQQKRPSPLARPHLESKASMTTSGSTAFHASNIGTPMFKSNMALSKLGAAPPKAFLKKLGEVPEKFDKTTLPDLARTSTEKGSAFYGKQNRA